MPITNFKYENGKLWFDWLTDFRYVQLKVSKGGSCANSRLTMEQIPFWIDRDYESERTVEITAYGASNNKLGSLQKTVGPDRVRLEYSLSEKKSEEAPKNFAKRIFEWVQGKGKAESNQSKTKEFILSFRLGTEKYPIEKGDLYYQVAQKCGRLRFPLPGFKERVQTFVLYLPGSVDVGQILIRSTKPHIQLIKT